MLTRVPVSAHDTNEFDFREHCELHRMSARHNLGEGWSSLPSLPSGTLTQMGSSQRA
jgi:hypothetical protein